MPCANAALRRLEAVFSAKCAVNMGQARTLKRSFDSDLRSEIVQSQILSYNVEADKVQDTTLLGS